MSLFLYKKIWHGISIHTRKCIPAFFKTKMAFCLQDALGLDESTVKSMVSLGLTVLMIALLGTLIWALRRGGSNKKVDTVLLLCPPYIG